MDTRDRMGASAALSRGMMSMLLRRHPPQADLGENELTALEDLVKALTQALSQGQMSIDLSHGAIEPGELSAEGWPEPPGGAFPASLQPSARQAPWLHGSDRCSSLPDSGPG